MKTISEFVQGGIQSTDDLAAALTTAMRLELATLPPYLCAQWSIKDDPNEPEWRFDTRIERIAVQEMYHFALAGNILAAIGHQPKIAYPTFTPTYPTDTLPGAIKQALTVDLKPLTPQQLDVFMQIENPQFAPVVIEPEVALALVAEPAPATIGDFYDTILAALETLPIKINPDATFIQFGEATAIKRVDDAKNAIKLIQEEGEGLANSPDQDPQPTGNLAHYYVFEMLKSGTPYIFKDGKWHADPTKKIQFPSSYDFGAGGSRPSTPEFSRAWTALLKSLENSWKTDGSVDREPMHVVQKLGTQLIREGIRPDFAWLE